MDYFPSEERANFTNKLFRISSKIFHKVKTLKVKNKL
jgi:hypothetical protein